MRGDGEEVAERGREKRRELLFREELEEGGFEVVYAMLETGQELHGGKVLSQTDAVKHVLCSAALSR